MRHRGYGLRVNGLRHWHRVKQPASLDAASIFTLTWATISARPRLKATPTASPIPTTVLGSGSFIDSGSNGLYFPNASNIPPCPTNTAAGDLSGFYCPSSTDSLTATHHWALMAHR